MFGLQKMMQYFDVGKSDTKVIEVDRAVKQGSIELGQFLIQLLEKQHAIATPISIFGVEGTSAQLRGLFCIGVPKKASGEAASTLSRAAGFFSPERLGLIRPRSGSTPAGPGGRR